MTRNPTLRSTTPLLPGAAAAPDTATAMNDWLEWQLSLFGTGLGQLITLQQGLWSAWAAQMSALMVPLPSPQVNWWSADSPFWQRGTEQLG